MLAIVMNKMLLRTPKLFKQDSLVHWLWVPCHPLKIPFISVT